MKYRIFLIMYPGWIFSVLWIFGIIISICEGSPGLPTEYCSYEKFSPKCEDNQVVVLKSARYGHMYTRRCITEEHDYGVCESDQLQYLDKECSGKQECEVDVSSKDMMDTTDCSEILRLFLEASYNCQNVLQPKSQQCSSPEIVSVSEGSGYLSSTVSVDTNCGTSEAPWLLEALPGQRINLTMTDFGWGLSHSLLNRCPTQYGHLLDYNHDDFIDICGGTSRVKQLLLSDSHQVQVILDPGVIQNSRFIIKYEAIGCPDKAPPKNGYITKKENGMTIGCLTDSKTWQLKCIGNHWLGAEGNCSDAGEDVKVPDEETVIFNSDHVISVAIGSLALVVCCVTVTIGVYLVKKHQYKASYMRSGSDTYVVPIPYRGATQHPTVYTKYQGTTERPTNTNQQQQQQQQQLPNQSNLPDIADLNNTTRTGFTFQRPGGGGATILRPTTAVEVHRMPAHVARSKTLFHPGNGSAPSQCYSPRHRTLVPQRTAAPTNARPTMTSQRPQPPPLPHRNNEEATSLLPQTRPRASLPNENALLSQSEGGATGEGNTTGINGRGDDYDNESVKYYVLEGPTPTLNSDNESNA